MKKLPIQLLAALIISILLFLLIKFFFSPQLFKVNDSFNYNADIISLDNFYDADNRFFEGEQRSVTTFSYGVVGGMDGVKSVNNNFIVRTVTGEEIININRVYGIDSLNWTHKAGYGDKDRNGYLFAPRGHRDNSTFSYWHVNYDKELEMVFDGNEVIEGLNTKRFIANFSVDQTDDLTHLPDVPEKRGINLDVNLTLWIEPVSGWLVKYNDSAVAYYYDINSGERLHPWNKFGNTYSFSSILEQVENAKELKFQINLLELGLPFAIGLLIFASVLFRRREIYGISLLAISSIGALIFIVWDTNYFTRQEPINVGISRWVPAGNTVYDENIQGFKDALTNAGYVEGKNIVYSLDIANADPDRQREIARNFKRNNYDLIYSLTTPGTLILKEEITQTPIVFSIVTYPIEAGIIDSINRSTNNLVGTRNWVPVENQLATFLEIVPTVLSIGFVHRTGEANSTIQFEEMQNAASTHNVEIFDISAPNINGLEQELNNAHGEIDAIYSACDTLVQGEAEDLIVAFALENKIPSFSCNSSGPVKGDLLGMVADFYEIGKLAGEKASLILGGATPASLETNTVSRPNLIINQKTADSLNIIIPQDILAGADEIIN